MKPRSVTRVASATWGRPGVLRPFTSGRSLVVQNAVYDSIDQLTDEEMGGVCVIPLVSVNNAPELKYTELRLEVNDRASRCLASRLRLANTVTRPLMHIIVRQPTLPCAWDPAAHMPISVIVTLSCSAVHAPPLCRWQTIQASSA